MPLAVGMTAAVVVVVVVADTAVAGKSAVGVERNAAAHGTLDTLLYPPHHRLAHHLPSLSHGNLHPGVGSAEGLVADLPVEGASAQAVVEVVYICKAALYYLFNCWYLLSYTPLL